MAMRRRTRNWLLAGLATAALAIPALGQDAPESLLPPGFGESVPAEPPSGPPPPAQPTAPGQPSQPQQGDETASLPELLLSEEGNGQAEGEEEEDTEDARLKFDLPDYARRTTDHIGILTPRSGGLGRDAFGQAGGGYLTALMTRTRAPIVSRWASIMLRRALLSDVNTPGNVKPADWIAERAWLLLRMGEADAARMLVQSIDTPDFTPRLFAIAMQTYLATADPAGLCPLTAGALRVSKEPGWKMSRAICAALSNDQGLASAYLNEAEHRGIARGIDFRLAEKVVGAGLNSRRSVHIEWEGVDRLTAWRYGLATATAVEIPDDLWRGVGPHVLAWKARAALLPLQSRVPAVHAAARLGVFSSAALVDFYGRLYEEQEADGEPGDMPLAMRNAYAAPDIAGRLEAMQVFWTRNGELESDYSGYIAMARAAARLPVSDEVGDDIKPLIASMLAAGLDRNAQAWSNVAGKTGGAAGEDAWAMLALGLPQPRVDLSFGRIDAYRDNDGSENYLKTRMLVAGLAGLGRLNMADLARIAPDIGFRTGYSSRWSRAIAAAARRGERGTVALLAAVGMQGSDWRYLPPEHLLHIVSALRRVGYEPEARMIAAEAIARL